jgi:hypothetical protein
MVLNMPSLLAKPKPEGETEMDSLLGFASLVIATILALFTALALAWLLLQATFVLMQPATADRRNERPALESGVRMAARAYGRGR